MNNEILMNFVLPFVLVVAFAFYMFRPKKSKVERNMGDVVYNYLAPKDAEKKLQEEDILLIDVRNADYYARSHLKGSINFPYAEIHHTARKRIPNKKANIVVYDNDNGNISKAACREFYSLGYKNVADIGSMNSFRSYIETPPKEDEAEKKEAK